MPPSVPFIQIEPTTRCNFSCGFCPGRHLRQRDMGQDVFAATLGLFPEIGHVQLYGEGEPLLHARFFSMAREAAALGAKVSTVTNGSLLKRNLSEILASGLCSIHVSIESADQRMFRQIRGGNLDQVLEGIALLVQHKREGQTSKPFVGFSLTILASTMQAVDDVFATYARLSMDGGVIVQPLNEMPSYTRNYPGEVADQILTGADVARVNLQLENNERLKDIQKTRGLKTTFFEALRQGFEPEQHGCPWLLRSLFVNVDGQVMPCSMIKDFAGYSFGNVLETDRETILEKREGMRLRLMRGDAPDACRHCRTLDAQYKPGRVHH